MDFNPNNPIVKACLEGMDLQAKDQPEEASQVFLQAWNQAATELEEFLAAYFVAQQQKNMHDKLNWFENALQFALLINDEAVKSALPVLFSNIAQCYEQVNNYEEAKKNYELALLSKEKLSDKGPFYHGTKADLQVGDFLNPGNRSNYQQEIIMNHIYFTALVNGAGLAAGLAKGEARQRVYRIEPTGPFESDPNVTDKKFPGNLTRSYRTQAPLKIVGEVTDWDRQTPEHLQEWRQKLATNTGEIIN